MLWVLIRIALSMHVLWRIVQNYPLIIIEYKRRSTYNDKFSKYPIFARFAIIQIVLHPKFQGDMGKDVCDLFVCFEA